MIFKMDITEKHSEDFADGKEESTSTDALKLAFEVLKNYKNTPKKGDSKYKDLLDSLKKENKK